MGKASGLKPAAEVKTALLLVDIQKGLTTETGYFGTERSTPQLEDNVAKLLLAARNFNKSIQAGASAKDNSKPIFIIHVYHKSSDPKSPLWPEKATHEITDCAAPVAGEPVLSKTVNCGFIGTDLEKRLREQEIKQIIIFGLTTDHCVSTTARLAANLEIAGPSGGDGVVLVSDASAAFNYPHKKLDADTVHTVNLASLDEEFANVVTTEEVLNRVIGQP